MLQPLLAPTFTTSISSSDMSFPCSLCLILNCLTILLIYCFQLSRAGNNETDRLALYKIRAEITHDPLHVMSSWNDSLHFCEWQGVICSRRHRRVTQLQLSSSSLSGTLSPHIGNLSFLRALYIQNNSFVGTIPSEIGLLHRLQSLFLLNNSFAGVIPSNISGCANLIELSIGNNRLVGEIPSGLGSLSNLLVLSMSENSLTGVIPSSLGNLTSLYWLAIAVNNLSGPIPSSLGRLKNLTICTLAANKLSESVPPSIYNLSFLTILDLGYNHLVGSLPSHIGATLPSLQDFSINTNRFSGQIPASISNSSNLISLQLASNNLHGQVPPLHRLERLEHLLLASNLLGTGQSTDLEFVHTLANVTTLDELDIRKNNFKGMFPRALCNFTALSYLGLAWNRIAGQIPICMENLAYLQHFVGSNNELSGIIPSGIGKLQNLGYVLLDDNRLSGYVPSNIGNVTQLTGLSLAGNNFEGQIPSSLGNSRYREVLDLSSNNLSGRIPSQLFSHSASLMVLNLSNNSLIGSLPVEIGKLKNLAVLIVSSTMLSGKIPNTLGACTELEYLYMEENFLQGTIPSTFIDLRGLLFIDLSWNNLSGEIPKFLSSFQLLMLNLSHNSLEGEVPIGGIFSNVTGLSISGNIGLCGGIPELELPECNSTKAPKRRLAFRRRLTIGISSGLFGFLLLAACISLYAFCFKKRREGEKDESENSLPNPSYKSLLKATNGFSPENLIGRGTFGAVYKGILDPDKNIVAIKIFNLQQKGASKSFLAECQVLRNVRHRNLVKVITACSSMDYQGNDFKAIIYEFMTHGSLEDWLHQKPIDSAEGTIDASRNLNLLQRIDIAVDVACALEYLHHHCGASIVHCDLKPSNVLLNDEMVAHVGDFGLAKFLSSGIASFQTNQSSSVGVRGTIGYAPPEYGLGNELSTDGDVYSFGILLLEIFTGKRPTDDMFKEGISLQSFVQAAWPERVMEILDHVLLEDIIGEATDTSTDHTHHLLRTGKSKVILEAVTAVLGIALSCSAELPQDRLDMSDVAAKLSSIRSKLHGVRSLRQRQIPAGEKGY